jgi:hypothetical protein
MIDFIKIAVQGSHSSLLDHPEINFHYSGAVDTGEAFTYPMTMNRRYKAMAFKLIEGRILVNGSIHKYWQSGRNWKDFDLFQLRTAIESFCNEFGVDASLARIHNLEFGVNINPPFEATLSNIKQIFVSYKGKPFELMESKGKKCIGVVCKFSQYQIKIYSKTLQYRLTENVLRIEIKTKKMQRITVVPMRLKDITEFDNFKYFKSELVRVVEDIIVLDDSLQGLSKKQMQFLIEVSNPNYWMSLSKGNRYKKKNKYKRLVEAHSKQKLQQELIRLVEGKGDFLTAPERESLGHNITPSIIGKKVASIREGGTLLSQYEKSRFW